LQQVPPAHATSSAADRSLMDASTSLAAGAAGLRASFAAAAGAASSHFATASASASMASSRPRSRAASALTAGRSLDVSGVAGAHTQQLRRLAGAPVLAASARPSPMLRLEHGAARSPALSLPPSVAGSSGCSSAQSLGLTFLARWPGPLPALPAAASRSAGAGRVRSRSPMLGGAISSGSASVQTSALWRQRAPRLQTHGSHPGCEDCDGVAVRAAGSTDPLQPDGGVRDGAGAGAGTAPSMCLQFQLRAVPRLFDVPLGPSELRELLEVLRQRSPPPQGLATQHSGHAAAAAAAPAMAVDGAPVTAVEAGGCVARLPLPANPALLCRLFHAGLAPPAIFRILQYKACRGAVMFGDALSHDHCWRLVRDLAACAHPFQCAHGRPSVAPLVTLLEG